MPGFELRQVTRRYDHATVLDGVTLRIDGHQHTALLGPSGSGKSTLLRLLAGLDAPSSGEIWLDASMLSRAETILVPPHRRRLTMVFQDLALWPNLSALDNVELGLAGARLTRAARTERARDALTLAGIAPLADRRPGVMSGGEQQRLALARALAPRPAFLFLDEPFASVDLRTKARLLDEIAGLAEATPFALLLVTHDPLEALALCTSAIVLEGGRVAECGALRALLQAPQSDTLRAFREQLAGAGPIA